MHHHRPSPDEGYLFKIRGPFHEAAAAVIFLESTCTDLHIAKVCRSRRSWRELCFKGAFWKNVLQGVLGIDHHDLHHHDADRSSYGLPM
jgi:hypothetical protein